MSGLWRVALAHRDGQVDGDVEVDLIAGDLAFVLRRHAVAAQFPDYLESAGTGRCSRRGNRAFAIARGRRVELGMRESPSRLFRLRKRAISWLANRLKPISSSGPR